MYISIYLYVYVYICAPPPVKTHTLSSLGAARLAPSRGGTRRYELSVLIKVDSLVYLDKGKFLDKLLERLVAAVFALPNASRRRGGGAHGAGKGPGKGEGTSVCQLASIGIQTDDLLSSHSIPGTGVSARHATHRAAEASA